MEFQELSIPDYYRIMQCLTVNDGYVSGLVNKEELDLIIEMHCKESYHYYISSHFTNFEKRHSKHAGENPRVVWQYKAIPFTGIPFLVRSYREHRCQYGSPYSYRDSESSEENMKEELILTKNDEKQLVEEEHCYRRKRKKCKVYTGKPSCPGKIKYRELIRYPQYRIDENEQKRAIKHSIIDKLKAAITKGEPLITESVYHLSMPLDSSHTHVGGPKIHPLLSSKIESLVLNGITNAKEVSKYLKKHVLTELKDVEVKESERYFPRMKDIRRLIARIISDNKISVNLTGDTHGDNILVELPNDEALSKLLSSPGIQLFTVPASEANTLPTVTTDGDNNVQILQNGTIDNIVDSAENIQGVAPSASTMIQDTPNGTTMLELIASANPDINKECDSFVHTIQDKLLKIQQLSPAVCDKKKRNSLIKMLDAQIENLMNTTD